MSTLPDYYAEEAEAKRRWLDEQFVEQFVGVVLRPAEAFKAAEIDWFALAVTVRCKRFGEAVPADFKERAKQQRFLQYRGFSHEQITESFNHDR